MSLFEKSFITKIISLIKPTSVIYLVGPMGAGKTTLAKQLIRTLLKDKKLIVGSPTYNLVNKYKNIYHLDLFRLKDGEEVAQLNIDSLFTKNNIVIIEWPQKVANFIPEANVKIEINEKHKARISIPALL